MLYAQVNGQKTPATPNSRAICPSCGSEVMAKCGQIKIWHWAHVANDQNCQTKPETEWHIGWKSLFSKENCEVRITKDLTTKIADVYTDSGLVVEFQHSTISVEEIQLRESFYNNMIWVFDIIQPYSQGRISIKEKYSVKMKKEYISINWKHAKQHIRFCSKPVYLDTGESMFRLMNVFENRTFVGWGTVIQKDRFVNYLLGLCQPVTSVSQA